MGLFSKSKEEVKSDLPPMPPAAPSTAPAPMAAPESNKSDSISDVGKLELPTIPGSSSFDDIKSQVVGNTPKLSESVVEESNNSVISTNTTIPDLSEGMDSDSLFDLSDIDMSDSQNKNISNVDSSTSVIDTSLEHPESLNFVSRSNSRSKRVVEENIFVTTAQFKALLEIVESVKSKVKDASETHLRLLDIKSEEDIEYENLRKSFQFIEDKLYEVDSLIFEK